MKVSLELKGMKEVEKEVMKIVGKTKEVRQEIAESSLKIQKKAKERLADYKAIDTGHLRNSIIVEFAFNGDHAEIGPTARSGRLLRMVLMWSMGRGRIFHRRMLWNIGRDIMDLSQHGRFVRLSQRED